MKPIFTVQQVQMMKRIGLSLDFDSLSEDDYVKIEETVGDYLERYGLDEKYQPNKDGRICEAILDRLSSVA